MSNTSVAPVIVRLALALLFLWFAVQQLMDPSSWVGFLPEWLGYIPASGETFVRLNGWFELVLGVCLLFGIWVRPVALLLGGHLLGIAAIAGGAIGVRDATLAMVTLTLVLSPTDVWSIDRRFLKAPTHTDEA